MAAPMPSRSTLRKESLRKSRTKASGDDPGSRKGSLAFQAEDLLEEQLAACLPWVAALAPPEGYALRVAAVSYWPKAAQAASPAAATSALTGALLKAVSFQLKGGQLMALLGPSGSGKSTLLSVVSGRRRQGVRSGSVSLCSAAPCALQPNIAYMLPDSVFLNSLTVEEVLRYQLLLVQGGNEALRDSHVLRRLTAVLGLDDALSTSVALCSSGEQRRVHLAQTLLSNKPILFLDEPTSGACRGWGARGKGGPRRRWIVCLLSSPSTLISLLTEFSKRKLISLFLEQSVRFPWRSGLLPVAPSCSSHASISCRSHLLPSCRPH